ncbi:MAG: chromosomal replication initiator protein DnaA [Acidimicrobiia bacterium]
MVSNWDGFRRVVRQAVGDGTWDRWFDPLTATEEDGILTLHTTSDIHTRWLKDRFLGLLEKAADQVYGEVELQFTVVPEAQLDLPPSQIPTTDPRPEPDNAPAPAPTLLHRYTFEDFVVGSSNRFAHAAAQAVAEQPGSLYNPLFIHGGAGLGKTHLLHAVGHLAHMLDGRRVVRYVTSERFLNDFIDSIRERRVDSFKAKYRTIDVLLLDDVQFFQGKEQILEEFFHTFNALYESGKQMVISSDRHPRELSSLEDRLRSRFEWGLLTDIQPPDVETRLAILERNARVSPVPIPFDVLEFIAKNVSNNIRELEGALTRVTADSRLNGHPVTLEGARSLLSDLTPDGIKVVDGPAIIAVTADAFGYLPDDITSKSRKQPLVTARQIAMYLCRELTDDSLVQIGALFNRDHSTVLHSIDKVKTLLGHDREVFEKVNTLSQRLRTTE